jgi:uncharacterized repeat protein (TIGR01451 family)
VTGDYYDPTCTGYFEIGDAYSSQLEKINLGPISKTNTVSYFSAVVPGLIPNRVYNYRAGVNCASGSTTGDMVSFYSNAPVVLQPKKIVYVAPVGAKTTASVKQNTNSGVAAVANANNQLGLAIESLDPNIAVGGQAAFRLSFKNKGNKDLQNISFKVLLGNSLTLESASVGDAQKGAKEFTVSIPQLGENMGGEIILLTNISKSAKVGDKLTLNTDASYTTTAGVKGVTKTAGLAFVNEEAEIVTANTAKNWQPKTFLEWLITFLVLAAFIAAVRVVVKAFKKV